MHVVSNGLKAREEEKNWWWGGGGMDPGWGNKLTDLKYIHPWFRFVYFTLLKVKMKKMLLNHLLQSISVGGKCLL